MNSSSRGPHFSEGIGREGAGSSPELRWDTSGPSCSRASRDGSRLFALDPRLRAMPERTCRGAGRCLLSIRPFALRAGSNTGLREFAREPNLCPDRPANRLTEAFFFSRSTDGPTQQATREAHDECPALSLTPASRDDSTASAPSPALHPSAPTDGRGKSR